MRKFPRFIWLLLLIASMVAPGCLDITEEYFIRRDGSGTMTYNMDISQMMEMMESFGGELGEGMEGLEDMDEVFEGTEMVEAFENMPGISNIKNLSDKKTGMVGYSFDFQNLDALNNAIEQQGGKGQMDIGTLLGGGDEGPGVEPGENKLMMKGKKFTRLHPFDDMTGGLGEDDAEGMAMAEMMFAEANYTVKYTFEQNVKKVSHPNAAIGGDNKSVLISEPLMPLLKGESKMGTTIKLKK